jgi:hypothetical protein
MSEKKFKYMCVNCKFNCNEQSRWKIHITTEKHLTGKRKIRCDYGGPYKCTECEYETPNSTVFKQHGLDEHSSKIKREKEFKFYCKLCDFGNFSQVIFNKHLNTSKHNKLVKNNKYDI